MNKKNLLILAFNRPEFVEKLLNSFVIEQLKGRSIYVSIDGPRNEEDLKKINNIISLIKKYEQKNNIKFTIWRNKSNLGCKLAVSGAITKSLKINESIIILEDDCIPSESFLPYCDYNLEKYSNNNNIFMINGTTFTGFRPHGHRLSKCTFVWGWATWKRAWKLYDVNMKSLSNFDTDTTLKKMKNYLGKLSVNIIKLIQNTKNSQIDTWDAQWAYCVWKNNGLTILPSKNLITNIGFGKDATHTKFITRLSNQIGRILINFKNFVTFSNKKIKYLDNTEYEYIERSVSFFQIPKIILTTFLNFIKSLLHKISLSR